MATTQDYIHFIAEQLSDLDDISIRSLMGEYIVYYRGKIAAYVCDNRFLVKPVASAIAMLPDAPFQPPYEGAKDMLLVEDIDNRELLLTLFEKMYDELPAPKPKKKK